METRPCFGYVSTLSLKSALIINELHFSLWPRPDGSPVAIAENTYGNLVTLHGNAYRSSVTLPGDACAGKPLFRVAVTLDLIPFATSKVRHEDRLAAILDGRS